MVRKLTPEEKEKAKKIAKRIGKVGLELAKEYVGFPEQGNTTYELTTAILCDVSPKKTIDCEIQTIRETIGEGLVYKKDFLRDVDYVQIETANADITQSFGKKEKDVGYDYEARFWSPFECKFFHKKRNLLCVYKGKEVKGYPFPEE